MKDSAYPVVLGGGATVDRADAGNRRAFIEEVAAHDVAVYLATTE